MPNVLFCARIDSGDKHWSRVRSVGHQSYCKCILPEASNNNKNTHTHTHTHTHTQSVPLHIRTFFLIGCGWAKSLCFEASSYCVFDFVGMGAAGTCND